MSLQVMLTVSLLSAAFLVGLVAARIPDPDDLADEGAGAAVVRRTRVKANVALGVFFAFFAAGMWVASVPTF